MDVIRVYADTSVFGGAFDSEFADPSISFFDRVREGVFELVVSSVVLDELRDAPDNVRLFFERLEPAMVRVDIDAEAYDLQQAYLRAHVVEAKWEADALHVAVATVAGCRAIVSWNFRHIVNFRRIPLYNAVNQAEGYGPLAIHTPPEVLIDDDEEEDL